MSGSHHRRLAAAVIGLLLAGVVSGCGSDGPSTRAGTGEGSAPVTSASQAPIGPDETTVKQEFLPVLTDEQAATSAALGEMNWLDEPTFSYRQSATNFTVATVEVTGLTQASTDLKGAWLDQTNQVLAGHGFEQIDDYRTDEGDGLLLVSAKPASDACFTARWGQGSVALTIEVGAPDSLCRLG